MADNFKIDRTDFGILEMLMEDAGLSNKQITAGGDLAPSSCHERVKASRSKGILLGSHAEVNYRALGLALEVFVQVAKLAAREVDDFVRETGSVREVRSVFLVSEHFNRHVCVLRVETSGCLQPDGAT